MQHISRRMFLARSAAAAGLAPAMLRGSQAVGPNDRIRMALIGCGGMGRGDLATFLSNAEVDCAVICDVDDAQLAKGLAIAEKLRGSRPDAIKDFRRAIDRKDVDICVVVTPDHWHALPTVSACQAGKDVYVQKPLATTIAEGRAMLGAAKKHKRVVQMGTQWRSGAHYQEAIEFVQSGKLGRIRQVRIWAYLDWVGGIGRPPDGQPPAGVDYNLWLGPAPERPFNPNRFHFNFRWFWDYAGGLETDWGVHLMNLALWAMGPQPPRTITSTGGRYVVDDNTETPDTQTTIYEFPSYTLVWEYQMLGGVGIGGRPHGVSFSGSEATLIVDSAGWELIPEPKKKNLVIKRKIDPADKTVDGRIAHIRNFLECVRSRKEPVTNLEMGHFVTGVAHLGNIALLSGNKIAWDAQQETVTNDAKAAALVGRAYRKPWSLPYMKS